MSQNNPENLPQYPAKPTLFSVITQEALNFVVVSLLRAIGIYLLWNLGLAAELHLSNVSFAAAVCLSMLSVMLLSSREIKLMVAKSFVVEARLNDISILMSSYIIAQAMKDKQAALNEVRNFPKTPAKKKSPRKTSTSTIDVDKSDESL